MSHRIIFRIFMGGSLGQSRVFFEAATGEIYRKFGESVKFESRNTDQLKDNPISEEDTDQIKEEGRIRTPKRSHRGQDV